MTVRAKIEVLGLNQRNTHEILKSYSSEPLVSGIWHGKCCQMLYWLKPMQTQIELLQHIYNLNNDNLGLR